MRTLSELAQTLISICKQKFLLRSSVLQNVMVNVTGPVKTITENEVSSLLKTPFSQLYNDRIIESLNEDWIYMRRIRYLSLPC